MSIIFLKFLIKLFLQILFYGKFFSFLKFSANFRFIKAYEPESHRIQEKQMENLGETIKLLRRSFELTQPQLAERIGVSKGIISIWENNINEPKATYVKKLCDFFEVSADYLLGRSDDFGNVTVKAEKTGEFLAPDEKSLMKNYRNLSAEWKNQVQTYIELINQKN